MHRRLIPPLAISVLLLTACSAGTEPESVPDGPGTAAIEARVAAIDDAVTAWRAAKTVPEAQVAAETARNLVVGPDGPLYGDANGDGTIQGANDVGLLPGLGGEAGLAQAEPVNSCVAADVLGGSWVDPQARWDTALAAIDAWAPASNTFPTLPSHPQRIVGWATLTLGTDAIGDALEYGGHAQLHVTVTQQAVSACA